jgi:hypothetical protein
LLFHFSAMLDRGENAKPDRPEVGLEKSVNTYISARTLNIVPDDEKALA